MTFQDSTGTRHSQPGPIIALLSVLLFAGPLNAQNPLFQDDALLTAVLSAPLTQAYRQSSSGQQLYFAGHWRYASAAGADQRVSVNVRPRGVFRRKNCERPPLQLNFKKKEVKESLLDGQDKLKLVGPCNRGSKYEQLVMLEQLAYQMYEILSDGPAFATRGLNLGFVDTDKKQKPVTLRTFVIEDESDMADRFELENVSVDRTSLAQLEPGQTAVMELFQYLIGNTDFSARAGANGKSCCHNIKLLASADSPDLYIPVPYDFDSSGLVNAPYAGPLPHIPISSVRSRYYMGFCRSPEYFDAAVSRFIERKQQLYDLILAAPDLSKKSRTKSTSYLDSFFATVENDKKRNRLAGRCRS